VLSLEPDSVVTLERAEQHRKQQSCSTVTDEGMQIDASEEHPANAHRAMNEICEGHSNLNDERDSHWLKQYSASSVTDEGMQIDRSDEA
jgi:hypothetical protein